MFAQLAEAIDNLVLSGDAAELCEVLRLRDRLDAKVTLAAAECRRAETYRLVDSPSLTAMLTFACGMSRRDAQRLSGLAGKLASAKQTADAWLDGTLSGGQVATLATAMSSRYRERYLANEADIIEIVAPLNTADTLIVTQRWKAVVDATDDSPITAPDHSELFVSTAIDTLEIKGSFAAEDGAIIAAAIDRASVKRPNQSPMQRRADALSEICRFYLDFRGTHDANVIARKQRPHLNVSISLDDLQGGLPGVDLGTGLVLPPLAVERLVCDANLHRHLFRSDSALLDYGRSARTAPVDLAQAVIQRDGGCRAKDCDRGPEHCEVHHLTWWEHDGPTAASNLGCFCPWDHKRIHRLGITIELDPDGTMTFTSPTGETWQTQPRRALPQLPFARPDRPPPRRGE